MSEFKIVCVDDEPMILEYIELVLEKLNYDIHTFVNPDDAFEFILKNRKSILTICSDFKMKEMSGFDLRAKLMAKDIEIPFLLLTGYSSEDLALEAMRLKIPVFLEKPVVEASLLENVKKYSSEQLSIFLEEKEMVTDFLSETTPMLDEIEDLILALEMDPEDEKAINTYFRLLHTIKGTSSCLGLNNLAAFAHKYEDLITRVKEKKLTVNGAVINALLKGFDYLKQMYECEKNFVVYPFEVENIISFFEGDFTESSSLPPNNENQLNSKKIDSKKDVQDVEVKTKEEKINISVNLLAEFLEISGEITVLKNTIFKTLTKMISKYPGDTDFDHLLVSINEMNKITSLLQGQVSEMKKISVDSVFRPMKRVVRDSAKVCNKNVRLETTGEEMRVDTSVGKLLNNILVHMLRNSVDHGIELPEKRLEIGKSEDGIITLDCIESGENIVITIEDDGNGIDQDRIKSKALEKEMYTEEQLDHMSKNRVFQILFESGFSTAEQITSVSGRGVGMDMVKSSVEEFGGKIFIDSTKGMGSKFVITIPIPRSVLIIKSLMIFSDNQPYAVPLDDVEKVVLFEDLSDGELINEIDGKKILTYHDKLLPLIELREILGVSTPRINTEFNIVILKGDGYSFGVVVDQIEDIEEIVVKKLAHPLNQETMFQGVTFIGDGDIGLILNPKGIASSYGIESDIETDSYEELEVLAEELEFMQFNLKGHSHYCIPLELVNRLEVFHSDQIEYSIDKPLVRYREGTLQLVLLEKELNLSDLTYAEFFKNKENIDVIVVDIAGEKRGILIHDVEDIGKTREKIDSSIRAHEFCYGTVFINSILYTVINLEKLFQRKISNKTQKKIFTPSIDDEELKAS